MTSLVEQMSVLQRQEKEIKTKIDRLKLEIEHENKDVNALERIAVAHINELSKLFTILRDKHGKRYKLHSGFHMTPTVELRIIEPGANPGGYDRYLDFDQNLHEDSHQNIHENVNTVLNES
mgnify:CR=1 FL=1|tara:strand:- start:335 stop:697 length:363 start_codon:yes stop_codon:yes gene_type:complete